MAGRIPRVFIHDLLARTDIVDLIDARVKLKSRARISTRVVHSTTRKPRHSPLTVRNSLPLLWMWRARQRDRLPDELRQARVR